MDGAWRAPKIPEKWKKYRLVLEHSDIFFRFLASYATLWSLTAKMPKNENFHSIRG